MMIWGVEILLMKSLEKCLDYAVSSQHKDNKAMKNELIKGIAHGLTRIQFARVLLIYVFASITCMLL